MAYLPKHKQKSTEEIGGILKDLLTGQVYNGPSIRDFLGNFYKGKQYKSDAEQLEFVPTWEEIESDSDGGVPIARSFETPSSTDYQKGTFTRYFVKEANSGKITEVNNKTFIALQKEGKFNRRVIKIVWYITGNPEDEIINGYLYPGTKAKNQDVINQAEKLLPGIGAQILKDPGQFVVR